MICIFRWQMLLFIALARSGIINLLCTVLGNHAWNGNFISLCVINEQWFYPLTSTFCKIHPYHVTQNGFFFINYIWKFHYFCTNTLIFFSSISTSLFLTLLVATFVRVFPLTSKWLSLDDFTLLYSMANLSSSSCFNFFICLLNQSVVPKEFHNGA